MARRGLWNLTFDMRGGQTAQPAGHPLDGRVRRRAEAPLLPAFYEDSLEQAFGRREW